MIRCSMERRCRVDPTERSCSAVRVYARRLRSMHHLGGLEDLDGRGQPVDGLLVDDALLGGSVPLVVGHGHADQTACMRIVSARQIVLAPPGKSFASNG